MWARKTKKPIDLLKVRSSGDTGGQGTSEDWSEQVTRLARRIWEAFARHKLEMLHVDIPMWEEMDPGQRETMRSLAAEALSREAIDPATGGPSTCNTKDVWKSSR